MTLDPILISNITLVAVAFATAFLVALWISLVFWTFRDIRRRSRDPLLRVLAALVVAVLFLPGVLIYLILRPPRTLDDEYQHSLEEEALLQSIEDKPVCPGCARQVKEAWTACPTCYTRLKKTCHKCGQPMDLAWNLCPFCGTPVPGMRRENLTMDEALSPIPGEGEEQ
jgi:amino acid transporter